VVIYPNPVINNLNIELSLGSIDEFIIDISNIVGQQIKENRVSLNKGKNNIVIPVSDLPAGLYILTITSTDKKYMGMVKFIK
jgi:hypothetical protein